MGCLKDLTGLQFGQITVLERAPNRKMHIYWKCKCSCGRVYEIKGDSLLRGRTKSCGCLQKDDITGKTYGKLNVVEFYGKKGFKHLYSCICECGTKRIVEAGNLRSGHTTSCGSCSKTKNLIGKRFGKLTVIEYLGKEKRKSKWKCLCDCGEITYSYTSLLNNKHKLSCGCLLSKAEMEFSKFLRENNYFFKTQYSFSDCLFEKRLKFDFAIFRNGKLFCLVELNGEQHYSPVTFKTGKSLSEKEFEVLLKRDKIKTDYCLKNKIPLLIIDYQNFKNKTTIFNEFFNNLLENYQRE